ncbi:MAG: NAD(P)/FAD-dependent oxidoreductase [Synergistes jonesii]|uniref:NAD(P)/FAD-dependent oxidoreductase n=1 Tax=Synergistes jonesii TaxID=2754 RepID=UPI002A74D2C2|nr:NAD(P)/FAD-dependent oxidoreductase [Synergistes jonesii]MDY2985819.1 NAD(P)/FAD-dependent oxidoreductase [Synergistes jonesii]
MKKVYETDLLVIGGGAAGLCAAAEAAGAGAKVTVIESDLHAGGQLVKQTHKFFGSKDEYAGTRGYKIADILLEEIAGLGDRVQISCNSTVTGYYPEDGVYTVMQGEEEYYRIKAKKAVIATGAQERMIPFTNNDLPGVYGAGAVQTLMNVYGVVPGKRVVMVGAGNIGLIVSYQLRQAGVEVAAVVEAMPKIGGYWVHAAKIRRLGIPVLLRHTVVEAIGDKILEGAVIQELDDKFQLIGEPEKIECDIICMAVGLTPTTELFWQAGCKMQYVPQLCGYVPYRDKNMRTSNPDIWVAGDASGIEEASAAMVEGRVAGHSAAKALGLPVDDGKFDEYWTRLHHLRAGEVGEKITAGINQVLVQGWEA